MFTLISLIININYQGDSVNIYYDLIIYIFSRCRFRLAKSERFCYAKKRGLISMKNFDELNQQEILALAISLEEEDERFYSDLSEAVRQNFPASAAMFDGMKAEESNHRRRLIELHQKKFGDHIPFIRRQDVKGFLQRKSVWLYQPINLEKIRKQIGAMETESRRFYEQASKQTQDASIRQLLDDLAQAEQVHIDLAANLENKNISENVKAQESESQRRLFLLQIVQPGLAGLMDGSVSTLAPLFAAAFATHNTWAAFLVGLAASVGAGISMGFAEALSDDGALTGRGHPLMRGAVCGLMTALGGIGHTLPFLISNFNLALVISFIVVAIELLVISWIRHRYMDTPTFAAVVQVMLGGILVFLAGIIIGNS
jgi:erythrin-vacuolar iron transport family protein